MKKVATLFFCMLLGVTVAVAQVSIIGFGDSWKYLDNGTDQGTAWRNSSFDDSGWNSGQAMFGYDIAGVNTFINYGSNPKQKHITTYFRKTITIDDPANFSSFTANIKRDDGLVLYVNGAEVLRSNMPTGTITSTTFAFSARDNGEDVHVYTLNPSVFTAGTNVIAVEVHQQKLNSSDLAFDMDLQAVRATLDETPPVVTSIDRYFPATPITSASSVTYQVNFSEPVTGVDPTDFFIKTASGTATGVLASDAVEPFGTNGTSYHVTVSSISGEGDFRLSLKSSGTDIADLTGNAISEGYTHGQLYTITNTPPPAVGFSTVTSLAELPISTNTAEKPQSKVWQYDGKWWAVLTDDNGTHVWRLNGTSWIKALTLSGSSHGRADCKVVGNLVHILMFRGNSTSYLYSIEYVPATGTYKAWSNRTSRSALALGSGAETATLEVDGNGRMWVAYDIELETGSHDIQVRWSDTPYSSWSSPITLETNVLRDDIAGIIALPGKIGVLWSNQITKKFGFKTHTDGSSPASWSADESPGSQAALDIRAGFADDHLNMALGSDGTLYCAIKTGYDTPGYTRLGLLVRRPDGSWDNVYDVSTIEGTRPIVILNEAAGKIKVIYTELEQSGDILYRESAINNIAFSEPMLLLDGVYNFATSSKNNYTSEVVILASNTSHAVGVIGVDAMPAAATSSALAVEPVAAQLAATKSPDNKAIFKASPNPFTNGLDVKILLPHDSKYAVALFNSRGEQMQNLVVSGNALAGEEKLLKIDGTNLPKGLYVLKLQTQTGTQTLRILRDY